jgi:hypothetical protein
MVMTSRQKLEVQLKKSRQMCNVTHGKKFSIGRQCVMLNLEVTMNCNSVTSEKDLMSFATYLCMWFLSAVS